MAEIFNLKKGNTENLGLRWIGNIYNNSRARYGTTSQLTDGGKHSYNIGSSDSDKYPAAFSGSDPQIFADYWNNPANSNFRNHFKQKMSESTFDYGDDYGRDMAEWDCLVIGPSTFNSALYSNVYEYVDLRRVQKLIYKGNPVFRLKKNGITTFQRQVASDAPAKISYMTSTMTSIVWRVTNDDEENIATDVYAVTSTSYPNVSTLYSSGSSPDGILNNAFKKTSTKISGGNYHDFMNTGLTPNTTYTCVSVLGDNTTSLLHSRPGYASRTTDQGVVVSFVSATATSITFKYTNKTLSTTTAIYAGPVSPGNNQVSSASVAPNGNTTATVSGLSPNTNYTIYVRGYNGSKYTTTASFTGRTLQAIQEPSIGTVNGTYCQPLVQITNPNNFTVSVYADTSTTTYYGTLAAGATDSFSIDTGMSNPAGSVARFDMKFYTASQGYSTKSRVTIAISSACMAS